MRRAQDLAVSADPDKETWEQAADRAEELVKLLGPFEAPEGVGPANRVPSLPGSGSLLMPPYRVTKFEPDGVELALHFSRFHVGGNYAVHGGVLPLMFDSMFGMLIHAAGRPISRTGFPPCRLPQGHPHRHGVDDARMGRADGGPQGLRQRRIA
jgi:acyl-coenzyme A thioesterase PaaI-like protein